MALRYVAFLLVAGAVSGCSSGPGELDDVSEDEATLGSMQEPLLANCGSGRLSDGMQQHSCDHYSYGPYWYTRMATTSGPYPWFGVAAADSPKPPPGSTSNYGTTHVYYTVGLPGSGGSYSGRMRFRPVSSGDHAIFVNNATFTIQPSGGGSLAPDAAISPSPGATSCGGFSGYDVYNLNSSTTYELAFSASVSSVNVLFERVSDYVTRWYQDGDADTWGSSAASVLTACAPPAGYSANRGSDCNDTNANINPTALEVCGDSIDSNCNGNDCT
jgi:Putative metal-binding motif